MFLKCDKIFFLKYIKYCNFVADSRVSSKSTNVDIYQICYDIRIFQHGVKHFILTDGLSLNVGFVPLTIACFIFNLIHISTLVGMLWLLHRGLALPADNRVAV